MGKLRIVKHLGQFKVQQEVTRSQYNEPYKTWEDMKNGDKYAIFSTQKLAENFVEQYIELINDKKEIVIKEYNYD